MITCNICKKEVKIQKDLQLIHATTVDAQEATCAFVCIKCQIRWKEIVSNFFAPEDNK